ncbi:MAG: alpha/beta fold hydrolase [Planctomycetaceae bacterium]
MPMTNESTTSERVRGAGNPPSHRHAMPRCPKRLRVRPLPAPAGHHHAAGLRPLPLDAWLLLILAVAYFARAGATTAAETRPASLPHDDLLVYRDDAGVIQPVKSVADWERRRLDILRGMEAAMGPLPPRTALLPFDPQLVADEVFDGYKRRTLSIVTEGDQRLPCDLYLPDAATADAPRAAIIALHPTGPLGKRIVAGDGPRTNRQYAVELARRGYVVIAPDYPSFGDYACDFRDARYQSGTMLGIFNHMRCVDYLQSLPEVDGNRIGVIGHSLGGHNAMFLGAFDPRVKVVVTSCGWTPFHDYYEGNITGWTSDRYMPRLKTVYGLDPDKVPFDFYEVAAALAPRPFFTNSPINDDNFAVAGVRKAMPKVAEIYRLFDAEDEIAVHHPPCDHDFPTETREAAYRLLDRALAHQPASTIDFSSELPRIPPREPPEAMRAFHVAQGLEVVPVATEPLVVDPVAMAFDEAGNLYVAEMRDYSEQETERLGRIRYLADTDGDGVFDESHLFLDNLSWPTALVCYDGGLFIGAAPDIWYARHASGDHRADEVPQGVHRLRARGVRGLFNSFTWGLDNRIHGATSSAAKSCGSATSMRPRSSCEAAISRLIHAHW